MIRSKLYSQSKGSHHLKMNVPIAVVEAMKLESGEYLDWDLCCDDNKIIATITKVINNA